MLVGCAVRVSAQTVREYRCELGLQGGVGYYVGDATEYVFLDVRGAYGLQFRYKFDQRWAIQVKGMMHHIQGAMNKEITPPDAMQSYRVLQFQPMQWGTRMGNVDVMGEFNFFRFGQKQYDRRVKQLTPFIGVGVGASVCLNEDWTWREYDENFFNNPKRDKDGKVEIDNTTGKTQYACTLSRNTQIYIPFVVGLKWKIAERWQLQVAWQHNVYFADNLEGRTEFCNSHNLNGSNLLNNDVTSQLTVGIVFEFDQDEKICRICE